MLKSISQLGLMLWPR